jgi:hypothetical protein
VQKRDPEVLEAQRFMIERALRLGVHPHAKIDHAQ